MVESPPNIKQEVAKYKKWTAILAGLCLLVLGLNVWCFLDNRSQVQRLKSLNQQMIDLKVELEGMRREKAGESWQEDAVTYSLEGGARKGLHLDGPTHGFLSLSESDNTQHSHSPDL